MRYYTIMGDAYPRLWLKNQERSTLDLSPKNVIDILSKNQINTLKKNPSPSTLLNILEKSYKGTSFEVEDHTKVHERLEELTNKLRALL